jgi:hypothetical protein
MTSTRTPSTRTPSRLLTVFLAALLGILAGGVVGLVLWLGGFSLLAVLSDRFDSDIDSDTIIFHGWGAAAMLYLFVGMILPPLGAAVGGMVGASGVELKRFAARRAARRAVV